MECIAVDFVPGLYIHHNMYLLILCCEQKVQEQDRDEAGLFPERESRIKVRKSVHCISIDLWQPGVTPGRSCVRTGSGLASYPGRLHMQKKQPGTTTGACMKSSAYTL